MDHHYMHHADMDMGHGGHGGHGDMDMGGGQCSMNVSLARDALVFFVFACIRTRC